MTITNGYSRLLLTARETAKALSISERKLWNLTNENGLRRVCQWAGNSAGTAMKNYALVKKTDFTDSGTQMASKKSGETMRSRLKKATPNPTL